MNAAALNQERKTGGARETVGRRSFRVPDGVSAALCCWPLAVERRPSVLSKVIVMPDPIKEVFDLYAAYGGKGENPKFESRDFAKFCKDAGLIVEKQNKFNMYAADLRENTPASAHVQTTLPLACSLRCL